ncbi:MAG: SWIM zinc finger family protein [Myxococcota bacterium]
MRADLAALGPDALAKLANVGLVKRATAEIAAGRGPTVEEQADGTVVGRSPDGAVCRIARGADPPLGTCSCGSLGPCRHRVATVLVYREQAAEDPAPVEPWDPGATSDEALVAVCGADALRRAHQACARSCVVEVEAGASPVARLPSSTVQLLVPRELAFARCDCELGGRCAHLVLAVWAFRAAPGGGVVELGRASAGSTEVSDRAEAAVVELLRKGVADQAGAGALAEARVVAEQAGAAWLADALQDLERHKEWYDTQSARFDPACGPRWAAEVASRARAARAGGPLPPAFVLGTSEPRQTWVDTVRWVGLGARLDADGARRSAEVWLADPDGDEVLLARGAWAFDADAPNGAALGRRFVSSRMSVASLVGAEVVVRGARRYANGRCDLGTARSMKATPFRGAPRWGELPASLVVRDLAAWGRALADGPPELLAPRRVGARVRVGEVAEIVASGWSAADQEARVVARDPAGTALLLRASHRTVAPGAPSALLSTAPALRFVAGALRWRGSGWEMTPVGLATESAVVCPDLSEPEPLVTRAVLHADPDPVAAALAPLHERVERGVQRGWSSADVGSLAPTLEVAGFPTLARLCRAVDGPAAFLDLVVATAWSEDPGLRAHS